VNLFGSSWQNPYNTSILEKMVSHDNNTEKETSEPEMTFDPKFAFRHEWGPYPFGVDPIWNLASNRLNFLNPMKMKTSVLLGISQMTFGLFLSLFNHIYFKSVVDIVFVFIPQLLFLTCIFIYLCLQIVAKWLFFWVEETTIFGYHYPGPNCAPSLLIGLINMFMMKSRESGFDIWVNATDINPNPHYEQLDQCHLQQWYPGQGMAEMILLFIAVICIPIMLFVKPCYQRNRAAKGLHVGGHGHGGDGEEFNFGDAMVYQAIHTIEFALGCISHTASYLRLWALSLAHAQLSDVLWGMLFSMALTTEGYTGAAMQYIFFLIFGGLSVSILILMEGLSAFLHALRLHWVEFQSKFYMGQGHQFEPLSFTLILKAKEGIE